MADVMRVMLFRRHKDGAPVPRADLTALVTKAYKDKRQLGPHVVALAQRRFLSTLGMEMQALDKVKRTEADVKKMVAAADKDKTGGVSYVLRSALPAHLRAAYVDQPEDAPLRGLTMTVLSLVAIAGDGGLPEDALWTQLASRGAPKGSKAHPALGDADARAGLHSARCYPISYRYRVATYLSARGPWASIRFGNARDARR